MEYTHRSLSVRPHLISLSPPLYTNFSNELHSVTAIARLSEILRQYQHAYYRQCTTVEEQFALALLTEPQIHSILDFCPTLRNRPDELYPEKVDENDDGMGWLSWSRHLMATILPHSMIQVYRPFLSRGFMDQRFNRAREVSFDDEVSWIVVREESWKLMNLLRTGLS